MLEGLYEKGTLGFDVTGLSQSPQKTMKMYQKK